MITKILRNSVIKNINNERVTIMVKMGEDRIIKTQCIFCGSRLKKIAEIHSKVNNEIMGYSLICCNCGHVDNFALDDSAIPVYTIGMRDNIKLFDLRCGIPIDSKITCDMECNMERPCLMHKERHNAPKPAPRKEVIAEDTGYKVPAPRIVQTISQYPDEEIKVAPVKPADEVGGSAMITAKPKNIMRPISFNSPTTKYQ
jgi:hypothetical protein